MADLTDVQMAELKKLVEGEGLEIFTAQEDAKEDLKVICKASEEVLGVKASDISKMIKTLYKSNLEEERAKFDEFDALYRAVMDNEVAN